MPATSVVQSCVNDNTLEVENQNIGYLDTCGVFFVEGILCGKINIVSTWKNTTVNKAKYSFK